MYADEAIFYTFVIFLIYVSLNRILANYNNNYIISIRLAKL